MTRLNLINTDGLSIYYALEMIKEITYPKAKEIYSVSDLEGNGIKANDTVIRIKFKNGLESTFQAKSWGMRFE